jgi:hypothetical protein
VEKNCVPSLRMQLPLDDNRRAARATLSEPRVRFVREPWTQRQLTKRVSGNTDHPNAEWENRSWVSGAFLCPEPRLAVGGVPTD